MSYFRDLDEATFTERHPEERHVGDFKWLIDQCHMDDDILCKTPSWS